MTARSLASLLDELVAAAPDATATIDLLGSANVPTSRSVLRERVRDLTAELAAAGLRPGQCVAVFLPNWSDTVVWQFAASALGAHVIGINTRYNVGEVEHVLRAARPAVVAVAGAFHGLDLFGLLRQAAAAAADDIAAPTVAVVRAPGPEAASEPDFDTTAFDLGSGAWVAGTGDAGNASAPATPATATFTAAGHRGDPDDRLAVAFTTSGSTGTPKLAAHRESAIVDHAHADADGMGVRPGDVTLCVLPLSGVFGFNTAMATLAGGAAILMVPVFDPTVTLRTMEGVRVTHIVGGDDLYGRLYDTWQDVGGDLTALRWLGIADFLGRSHQIARWARDEFGALTTGVFGSSEVFSLMLFWNAHDPESVRWNGGGRPVSAAIAVRIADPYDDSVLPDGEQGELQVFGPNVTDAYLGNPAAATAAFTDDGWFRSGDLAVATGDGGYTYVCRAGDALRLRGFLVDPAEIEARLAEHRDVQTAKVVGITGPGGYTQAVGFVVPTAHGAATSADLRQWCARSLASFKVPTSVHVIEKMPTTVGGNGTKIRAVELREWAGEWTDRERDFRSE